VHGKKSREIGGRFRWSRVQAGHGLRLKKPADRWAQNVREIGSGVCRSEREKGKEGRGTRGWAGGMGRAREKAGHGGKTAGPKGHQAEGRVGAFLFLFFYSFSKTFSK